MMCRFFNVWFLLSQVAAMLVCIGYVSERPAVVCFMCPTLMSCILADAFPRELRRKVTAFAYFVMVAFAISFDVSLLASLVPEEEPLEFSINNMEFSGKAMAFGCSINLLIFAARSVSILIFYPRSLVLYTRPLKNARYDPQKVKMVRTVSGAPVESTNRDLSGKRIPSSFRIKGERRFVLRPRHRQCAVNTKETVAGALFGKSVNKICWSCARNPLIFIVRFQCAKLATSFTLTIS